MINEDYLHLRIDCFFCVFQISMEGEVSELEALDSELVMSFYDQYHTEDLSKVRDLRPLQVFDSMF